MEASSFSDRTTRKTSKKKQVLINSYFAKRPPPPQTTFPEQRPFEGALPFPNHLEHSQGFNETKAQHLQPSPIISPDGIASSLSPSKATANPQYAEQSLLLSQDMKDASDFSSINENKSILVDKASPVSGDGSDIEEEDFHSRKFREEWKSQFFWLIYDETSKTMFCSVCKSVRLKGKWVTAGSRKLHISNLRDHTNSEKHALCLKEYCHKRTQRTIEEIVITCQTDIHLQTSQTCSLCMYGGSLN
jgi:hypothetical protein